MKDHSNDSERMMCVLCEGEARVCSTLFYGASSSNKNAAVLIGKKTFPHLGHTQRGDLKKKKKINQMHRA